MLLGVSKATTCIKKYRRQLLICKREPDNALDRYTVAVKREGTIVGHLPRKMTRVFAVSSMRYLQSIEHACMCVCTLIFCTVNNSLF